MPNNIESVIEKIRKLLALSKSSNEHEAASAARRAADLAAEYDLETAEIEVETGEPQDEDLTTEEVGTYDSAEKWRLYLLDGCCKMTGCRTYGTMISTKRVVRKLYGRPSQIRTAKYMYLYLAGEVERLAKDSHSRAVAKAADPSATEEDLKVAVVASTMPKATWRRGFIVGCAERLHDRMEQLGRPPVPAGAAGAIVLRRDLVLADSWAKFRADQGLKTKKTRARSFSAAAMRAGHAAGDGVNLNAGGRPQLGAAPAQIKGA